MIFVHIGLKYDYDIISVKSDQTEKKSVYFALEPLRLLRGVKRFLFKLIVSSRLSSFFPFFLQSKFAGCYIPKEVEELLKDQKEEICFFVNEISSAFLRVNLIDFLKREYRNCRVVFLLQDTVELFRRCINPYTFDDVEKQFDLVLTYNSSDSEKYGLQLNRPKIKHFDLLFPEIKSVGDATNDVFFVGKSKGRLKEIIDSYVFFTNSGLKCDFTILEAEEDCKQKYPMINFTKKLSYPEVLEKAANSKFILNIVQEGASGISIRDYEAICYNKTLITNNLSLRNYRFYSEKKVLFLDDLYKGKPLPKISSQTDWPNKEDYSANEWYCWIESLLNGDKNGIVNL